MRTTVTLDDDTERLVRRRMRERGESFKVALNESIRAGVQPSGSRRVRYSTPTFSMGAPAVNLDRALILAAELEDEEIVRKARSGK
ncbi:MAG TPA: hypothetical protein VGS21_00650 [Acidimicrobiales bacterium]|nr:hypothetical protein [Acidimicrobiales bacterium]